MRGIRFVAALGVAAGLLLPVAALAGVGIVIDPERLDGEFSFEDDEQGENNTLEFDVDGQSFGIEGQVQANAGPDVVTITYRTGFPDDASASPQSASISQDAQVLVTVFVDFLAGIDYLGQAAPMKCSASAKIRDNQAGDPDSPDRAQASLSCDLRNDWRELDDDDEPGTPGDPPQAALDVIEEAFRGRRDVRADVGNGRLTIKFKGGPP
jgi:hypothetical protein